MDNPSAEFYELLKSELRTAGLHNCIPDDELIALVLSRCELLSFPKNYRIIDVGDINNSLYILKSGDLRMSYYEEDREVTLGIGSAPTTSISPLGFVLNLNAHYMVTACSNVEVYRLSKKDFDALSMTSLEFTRWMMGLAILQMAMTEYKSQNLVGSTKEKYENLRNKEYMKKWGNYSQVKVPDVARKVNDRVIASFLGVHPVYLSAIKREIIKEERARKK